MIKEVETELNVLEKQFFSGHVRFGIEHGKIVSMAITTKLDNAVTNTDYLFEEIKKLFPDENDFYGSLDYNLNFGRIITSNYSTTFQGEQLAARLRQNQGREVKQCKSVKVVAKK